jgi:hypothetical protein
VETASGLRSGSGGIGQITARPRLKSVLLTRLVLVAVVFIHTACAGEPAVDDLRDPPDVITGTVTEVNEEGGEISSLVIEAEELALEVRIDPARDYGFDLNHLYEHMETEEPVRVPLEEKDGDLYAEAIEDA